MRIIKYSKILLISSSFEHISLVTASKGRELGVKTTDESHYPLGIAYLHSYLEAQGHNPHSLFLNNYDFDTSQKIIADALVEFSPDVVGLQMLTPNRVSSYRTIEHIHKKYPKIQIIVGGIHATVMYQQLLKKYPFLLVVLGEGELTMAELIKELRRGKMNLDKINGIAYVKNNHIQVTSPRELIKDLDLLPFPKHELFFNQNRTYGCLLTTRGCPFNCSFCSLDAISRRKVRYRSVKNVVDEIEYMLEKSPQMEGIWIHDDSFFLDNERVINICKEVVKRKIKLKFICSGRVKPISSKMVKALEKANFEKVLLGLESGDEGILKTCHKAITQQDVINVFKLFTQSHIELYAFLIIGLPGENLGTIKNTINFVKKLQRIKYIHYNDSIALLAIYTGTEVCEIAKMKGQLNDSFWLLNKPTPLFIVENSQEQLFQFKEVMLNNISMDRFLTGEGFKAQFTMLPYIMKYIWHDKNQIISILAPFAKSILSDKLYERMRRLFLYKI